MSWQRVCGHEALVTMFEQVVQRGRLGHAYLFVGPAGVGKRLFALELGKALLCEDPPDGRLEACDRCPACLLIDAGNHPDLFVVGRPEGSNELGIEPLRELCRGFLLKSAHGRGKVAVLDDADHLNEEAANCFLKTLEEPPPRSVFFLIGTARDRQMPTIVSRCQVVPFAPLPDALLTEILRQQGVADPALIPRLTRRAGGSPGRALLLADPPLWQFFQTLQAGLAEPRPHTVELAKQWLRFTEDAGKELAGQRRRVALVLQLLIAALNDALRLSLGGMPGMADPEEAGLLRKLAERFTEADLLGLIDRCLEADEQLGRYVQPTLIIEGLMDAVGQLGRERAAAPP